MTRDDLTEAIGAGVAELGQRLPAGATEKLALLLRELQHWNRRINLTAIRDPAAMVSGHILDSLAIRPLLCGSRVIDIGTGAGFPGLPLAIAEPARQVELLDSNNRKIAFVRHMIGELGIANAIAVQSRAEDYAPGSRFDTVISRALASTRRMIDLAGHLVSDEGVLLVLKGKYPDVELRELTDLADAWVCTVTELTVPGLARHSRHVVCLQRAGHVT
jgi:16S rRNA (guanine527-N7)-methyltransferase